MLHNHFTVCYSVLPAAICFIHESFQDLSFLCKQICFFKFQKPWNDYLQLFFCGWWVFSPFPTFIVMKTTSSLMKCHQFSQVFSFYLNYFTFISQVFFPSLPPNIPLSLSLSLSRHYDCMVIFLHSVLYNPLLPLFFVLSHISDLANGKCSKPTFITFLHASTSLSANPYSQVQDVQMNRVSLQLQASRYSGPGGEGDASKPRVCFKGQSQLSLLFLPQWHTLIHIHIFHHSKLYWCFAETYTIACFISSTIEGHVELVQ